MAAFILVKLSDEDSFVIGELHKETEEDIILNYPIIMKLKTTINQTTNVSTSKLMPFSENNLVAIKKCSIIGFSKPNKKIIQYFLTFKERFQKILDEDLENDIVGLQDNYSADALDYEEDDIDIEPLTINSSRSILH